MRGEKLPKHLLTIPEAVVWLREELGITKSKIAVWNWIVTGVQGVKLEAVWVGNSWHTRPDAIRRFLSASTKQHASEYGARIEELRL